MPKVKTRVRYHERRVKARRQMAEVVCAIIANAPDSQPTYRAIPDPWWSRWMPKGVRNRLAQRFHVPFGRWSVGEKVYPVKRPKRGKLLTLAP